MLWGKNSAHSSLFSGEDAHLQSLIVAPTIKQSSPTTKTRTANYSVLAHPSNIDFCERSANRASTAGILSNNTLHQHGLYSTTMSALTASSSKRLLVQSATSLPELHLHTSHLCSSSPKNPLRVSRKSITSIEPPSQSSGDRQQPCIWNDGRHARTSTSSHNRGEESLLGSYDISLTIYHYI